MVSASQDVHPPWLNPMSRSLLYCLRVRWVGHGVDGFVLKGCLLGVDCTRLEADSSEAWDPSLSCHQPAHSELTVRILSSDACCLLVGRLWLESN